MENYDVVNEIHAMLAECEDGLEIWNKVFDFILQSKAYLLSLHHIENIIVALVQKLLFSGCDDQKIVLRVVHMYQRCIKAKYGSDTTKKSVDYVLEPLGFVNITSHQLCDTEGVNFLGAVCSGDLEFVKLLVKYGICGYNSPIDIKKAAKCLDASMCLVIYEFHQGFPYSFIGTGEDILYALSHTNGQIGKNQRGFLRICKLMRSLVLQTAFQLFVNEDNNYSNSAINKCVNDRIQRCFNIYFNVMNEPFIAQDELKDFLKLLFANDEKCEEIVVKLVRIYRGMFLPEITRVYEPRTLKHQSRCAVRKYLSCRTGSMTLPKLISQQNVPPIIKELLLGAPEFK